MKLLTAIAIITCALLNSNNSISQITVDVTPTPTYCVNNVLLGAGITASNITFFGDSLQIGTFDAAGTSFPISNGVILATGAITAAPGPNNQGGATGTIPYNTTDDVDLSSFVGNTNDVAALEFDFVATGDSVRFQYVFASEEYPEFLGYADVFGFFLAGPGLTGPYSAPAAFPNGSINIAQLPGGAGVVSVGNVNNGPGNAGPCQNCAYYVSNGTGTTPSVNVDIQYDGHTVVLVAEAQLVCGGTYHIKLAIADNTDGVLDSGIFLEAKSFTTNLVEIDVSTANFDTITGLGATIVEGCDDATIALIRESSDTQYVSYFDIAGTAINGTDYMFIPDSVVFPAGIDTVYFTISTIEDDLLPGGGVELPESIILTTMAITPCGDTLYESDTIWVLEEPMMFVVRDPDTTIVCPTNDFLTLNATGAGGIPSYQVIWNGTDTGYTYTLDITTNGVYTIPIELEDSCHLITVYDTVTVTVNYPPPFSVSLGNDTTVACTGPFQVTAVPTGGAPNYLYAFNGPIPSANPTGTVNLTQSGWVWVNAYDACYTGASDSIYVTIDPPIPTIFTSPDTTIACPGDPAYLSVVATGGTAPYNYIWPTVIAVGPNATVSPLTTTTYLVAVTDGCLPSPMFDSVTVTVASYPPLNITLPDQSPTCPGDDVFLSPVVTGGNSNSYTYTWDGVASSTADKLVNPSTSTTYVFEVTDGCGVTSTESVDVTMPIYAPIDLTFVGPDTVCVGQEANLYGAVTGGAGGNTFAWSGPGTFVSQTQISTAFTADSTGMFTLYVTDQCGTSEFYSKLIIGDYCELYIPNILTPNGDGINDILQIINIERFGNHVKIMNRWGQVIFESDNYDNTWAPPTNLSDGTYFYYITLDDGREYSGPITILRAE